MTSLNPPKDFNFNNSLSVNSWWSYSKTFITIFYRIDMTLRFALQLSMRIYYKMEDTITMKKVLPNSEVNLHWPRKKFPTDRPRRLQKLWSLLCPTYQSHHNSPSILETPKEIKRTLSRPTNSLPQFWPKRFPKPSKLSWRIF